MSSRQAGWSAVANPEAAKAAFERWSNGEVLNDTHTLTLARDYAVLNNKGHKVIDRINNDLRRVAFAIIRRALES